jgi:delta(3,5)-delta(2,4)-dienoyl-CoA isomerase
MDLGNAGVESNLNSARASLATQKWLSELQYAIGAPARCPFPVIAAVHGSVLGLGVDVIAACDIRLASSSASFAIKASNLSKIKLCVTLMPADDM